VAAVAAAAAGEGKIPDRQVEGREEQ
jgi:hypothetical protein